MSGVGPLSYTIPAIKRGIYHLLSKGTVVYIGQTGNIWSRIGSHKVPSAKFAFDQVVFFPCEDDNLCELEFQHIQVYKPLYNKEGLTNAYRGTGRRASP